MATLTNTPLEQRIYTHWTKVNSSRGLSFSQSLFDSRPSRGDLLEIRGQVAILYDDSRRSCIRYSPDKKCVKTRHLLQYFRGDEMMEWSVYDRGLGETVVQRIPLSKLIRQLCPKKQRGQRRRKRMISFCVDVKKLKAPLRSRIILSFQRKKRIQKTMDPALIIIIGVFGFVTVFTIVMIVALKRSGRW